MTRPRVLLVDDEQEVVASLRRALSRRAAEFEWVTAISAPEALVALALAPCAVVVSDMQMPGINGLELLEEVSRTRPLVGRVLLTGTAESNASSRALPTAHRFLCKPSSIQKIAETCRDVHRYMQLAGSTDPSPIGSITALGIEQAAIDRARAAAAHGHAALLEIVDHPALAAALLHVTGSEFLGGSTEVCTLADAVGRVGPIYFEQMLDSGLLLPVRDEAAASITAYTDQARAAARALANAPIAACGADVLAALLQDVDRIGSSDMAEWSGMRPPRGAAALLGLWGAPAAIVHRLTEPHA
jgi:CheY-like chemotaxis protein